jgi:hypothetical protein
MPQRRFAFLSPRPKPRPEYLRLSFFRGDTREPLSLQEAVQAAQDCVGAEPWASQAAQDLGGWIRAAVKAPPARLWARPESRRPECWFKAATPELKSRLYDLKAALEACGVEVMVERTRDPGRVVFEDEHQIAAVPSRLRF